MNKLKGRRLNFDDSLDHKDIFSESEKDVDNKEKENHLSNNTYKVKPRKIKKPRKRGISFTQAINISEIKKEAEKKSVKVRGKRIKESVLEESDEITDQSLENEETVSIAVILVILLICFGVGIVLGYLLYHIAMNSSNALLIVQNIFH